MHPTAGHLQLSFRVSSATTFQQADVILNGSMSGGNKFGPLSNPPSKTTNLSQENPGDVGN
jgi:hypothetical protein